LPDCCYGGAESGVFGLAYGGAVSFSDEATAAESNYAASALTGADYVTPSSLEPRARITPFSPIFTLDGGTAAQTGGGQLSFSLYSTAASSTITIGAGSNGGLDAYLYFLEDSLGGQARIVLSGTLDIDGHNSPGVTTGSIEGSGTVILGPNKLTVGSTQLDTTFSGTIMDGDIAGGSLSVIGGQLTLSNDSTYTGGTSVIGGTLLVNNRTGSATGTGPVAIEDGTLAGRGKISGAVTIGNGSDVKAQLNPSLGTKKPATLTIQSSLTFKADGIYSYLLKTRNATADEVVVESVTIDSGAQFQLHAVSNQSLTVGQVLIAISNTSDAPISGNFSNLPDGSTLTVGNNTFQISYQGGDGNDLTLTVL
jgi:autotransporter-associated beta strand protein